MLKIFFLLIKISKCDACFYTHFQGLFKNIVFRSVALVIKKLWAILEIFYTLRTFYRPAPYPMHKKITKNPLNYYLLKGKKFHGDSVKDESASAK